MTDARGFELRDILDAPRSPATGEILYVDGYFMPAQGLSAPEGTQPA